MAPFGRANDGLSVPPNVSFQVDDFEDTWTSLKPFDYIHSRMMNTSVSNWTEYLRKSFEYGVFSSAYNGAPPVFLYTSNSAYTPQKP